jgi:hypothetical protein
MYIDQIEVKAVASWVGCMDYNASQIPSDLSLSRFCFEYFRFKLDNSRKITMCGEPGSLCICNGVDEYEEIMKLSATSKLDKVEWVNAIPISSLYYCNHYRPLDSVHQVECDVLFIGAELDIVTPASLIIEASKRAKKSQLYIIPKARHCDLYFQPLLQDVIARTVAFFLERR